jgi:hypothetical protein
MLSMIPKSHEQLVKQSREQAAFHRFAQLSVGFDLIRDKYGLRYLGRMNKRGEPDARTREGRLWLSKKRLF